MSAYSDLILSHSPVAYWRLGEASGTTAADATGNGHVGILTPNDGSSWSGGTLGTAGAISGDSDTAATFNGTSGYVSLPASSVFIPSANAAITVEAWMWRAASTGTTTLAQRALSIAASSTASRIILANGASNQAQVFFDGTTINVGSPANEEWHHLAVTFDGTSRRCYYNGSPAEPATVSTLGVGHSTTAKIGAEVNPGSRLWAGIIDDVAIYPVALTAAQVAEHYDMGINGPSASGSLLLRLMTEGLYVGGQH